MNWYPEFEVLACPQHSEAKKLANKYYTQWSNLCDKISSMALDPDTDFNDPKVTRKFNGLCDKADKIELEFNNVRRGIMKPCSGYLHCAPY